MDTYQNYLTIQRQNEMRKLQESQNRLAQLDAYFPRQQIQQGLSGRVVNSFDEIQVHEIPMDNVGASFIKSDYSEVEIRKWDSSGKIVCTRYRRVLNDEPSNLSNTDEKESVSSLQEVTDDILKRIDERLEKIEENLKNIEKNFRNAKKTTQTQKLSEE